MFLRTDLKNYLYWNHPGYLLNIWVFLLKPLRQKVIKQANQCLNITLLDSLASYVCVCVCACMLSHSVVSDSLISWTVACQVPLSMGFSRQEYWSGLPFPTLGDFPHPGMEPGSPALQADSSPSEPPGKPISIYLSIYMYSSLSIYIHSFLSLYIYSPLLFL